MALGTSLPARIATVSPVQTRYIAPTGNDTSGDGSITNPWRTPYKAFQLIALTGGLILCRGGSYSLSGEQTWSRTGNSGNPVQIKAYPGESPVFQGAFRFAIEGGSFLRLGPGLVFQGPGSSGALFKQQLGGTDNEIDGCTFIATGGGAHGTQLVLKTSGRLQIWNSEFVGVNEASSLHDHQIYFSMGLVGDVIANCVGRDSAGGLGVQLQNDADNVIITCCTYDGFSYLPPIGLLGVAPDSVDNVRVVGCLVTNNALSLGAPAIWTAGPTSGCVVSDCIGFGNGAAGDFDTDGATYINNIHANPLYTNQPTNDFTLLEDSPAYDHVAAAREGYVPVLDKNGAARTTADAGAYGTGAVAPPPDPPSAPVNTVAPLITGTAEVGQTLTVTNGTWQGQATITYARQWQRDSVDIAGETGTTYLLDAADLDADIRVEVTASNAGGDTVAFSNTVGPVGGASGGGTGAPANVTLPQISGVAQEGETLNATPGEWDGDTPMTFAFQWLRCDTVFGICGVIGGATSSSYLVDAADVFNQLRVEVTASN